MVKTITPGTNPLWGFLLFFVAITAFAQVETPITFKDRRLIDVIVDYKQMGFTFIFSSDLVDKSMAFQEEPSQSSPLERFNEAIREFSLSLKPGLKTKQSLLVQSEERYFWASGKILENTSDYPIESVTIKSNETIRNSGSNGEFKILTSLSTSDIYISHADYHSTKIPSSVFVQGIVDIRLEPSRLEEMVITASWYSLRDASQISIYDINAEDLASFPVVGQDVFRAASYLPGMSSNGISAQPHIRGGLNDETLVLFNDIELLEPFHLKDFQSIFSGLNPSLIESVDIYTGGFPARYGDKMSGVIDITPVQNIPSTGSELHMSFLSTGAAVYGELNNSDGHWIVSGRRGNLDAVFNHLDTVNGKPSYSDAYAQIVLPINSTATLDMGILAYNDNVTLNALELITVVPDEEEAESNTPVSLQEGEFAQSRYRNTYGWIKLQNEETKFYSSTTLSYGSIRHHRSGFITEFEEELDTLDDERIFTIVNLSHQNKQSLNEFITIEYGGKINFSESEYVFNSVVERDALAEFLGVDSSSEYNIHTEFNGKYGGVYASSQYAITPNLSTEFGLRWDFQDIDKRQYEDQISPRLSARLDVKKYGHLRFSLGRFYQPEAINELQVSDGVTLFQKAQHTDSVILGFDQGFYNNTLNLRLETFYKKINNPKFRYENTFNSLEILPELMDDRILISPSEARSSGIEITTSYEPNESFKSWISYSYSNAEDKINGQWQARIWEQDKTLVAGILWKPGYWTISSAIRWHSGWKTTILPREVDNLEPISIDYNSDELPEFFSLDLRISRDWTWNHHLLSFFLEVNNLSNNKNIGGIEYEFEENEDGTFNTTSEPEELLPIIPSIGFEWKTNFNR